MSSLFSATAAKLRADLASTLAGLGSALVGFAQGGAGAVPIDQQKRGRLTLFADDYGVSTVAVDNGVKLNALMAYADTLGGADILLPWGVLNFSTPILNTFNNVTLIGRGGQVPHDGGTGVIAGTTLQYTGAAGQSAYTQQTATPATESVRVGGGLQDLVIDGGGLASSGVFLRSLRNSTFIRVHVANCTAQSWDLTCYTSAGAAEAMDLQYCLFDRCTWRNIDTAAVQSAHGMVLDAPAGATANPSFNTFILCRGQTYDGHGMILGNCDNNHFHGCAVIRAHGTVPAGLSIRGGDENYFYGFTCGGANSIEIRGTASGYFNNPTTSCFFNVDVGNGTQYPTLDAGCRVFWHAADGAVQRGRTVKAIIADSVANANGEYDNFTSESLRVFNGAANHVVLTDGTNKWGVHIDGATGDLRLLRFAGAGVVNIGNGLDVKIGVNRLTYGATAPGAGTWAKGDRCWNNNPAVGAPKEWICTVAGTPGTWVSTGNL